jgi:hypothetical protein
VNGLTIVDTDILVDAAHQINEAVDCLAQIERQSVLAVSVITQIGNGFGQRRYAAKSGRG